MVIEAGLQMACGPRHSSALACTLAKGGAAAQRVLSPCIVAASALLGIKLKADWLLMLTGACWDAEQLTYCGTRMLGCCLCI